MFPAEARRGVLVVVYLVAAGQADRHQPSSSDMAPTNDSTLALHDALPICQGATAANVQAITGVVDVITAAASDQREDDGTGDAAVLNVHLGGGQRPGVNSSHR